ncbi:MAG: 50S ribosomal protein L9 [bacterium]|nr:50S ribosomal protein L9 [bacterium]
MKIILLQDVEQFGSEGDVVEVADGHARNFLFPKHLAVPATESAVRDATQRATQVRRDTERELHDLQRLAAALDGQEFTITAPANASGTLYGGIGEGAVVALLATHGFIVDPTWVRLEQPIKEAGAHTIRLQLPHGLEAELTVIVEAEA